jgi:hypothetical protein
LGRGVTPATTVNGFGYDRDTGEVLLWITDDRGERPVSFGKPRRALALATSLLGEVSRLIGQRDD